MPAPLLYRPTLGWRRLGFSRLGRLRLHSLPSFAGNSHPAITPTLLVSFITISGVRKLQDILQATTSLDASGCPRTRIRVLTTTYTGATEIEALDYLARLPGCEVKVSLDGRRTRLHAKAWIFSRKDPIWLGVCPAVRISQAQPLLGGLEWTVKFTQHGQASLYSRAKAHFETLWNDTEFQHYDANNPKHREELKRALKRETGEGEPAVVTFFDLEPKDYQKEMLEQLAVERQYGRQRNLVVAATGTGKTVVCSIRLPRIVRNARRLSPPAFRRSPRRNPKAGTSYMARGSSRSFLWRIACWRGGTAFK